MIVVAIIGLLAAIAIPNFVRARAKAQTNSCIANMKQLDGAIEVWATENKKSSGATVTLANLCPDYVKNTPVCPAGSGAYGLGTVGSTNTVTCPNVGTVADHKLP